MTRPDIIGYPLGEARKLLTDAGIEILKVLVTAPPREKTEYYDDTYRVIRWTQKDKKAELLVSKPL